MTTQPARLNLPGAIQVHNAAAAMHDGELYLSLVTCSGHVTTFMFEGEPLAALRAALPPQSWADRQAADLQTLTEVGATVAEAKTATWTPIPVKA